MILQLSIEIEKLVERRVRSGRYNSPDEVIREALRLLEQRDEVFALRNGDMRDQIEEGWQSARRGDVVDGDAVFDRIQAELAALEHSAPE
jgi:antitoxin ParD1/3/4